MEGARSSPRPRLRRGTGKICNRRRRCLDVRGSSLEEGARIAGSGIREKPLTFPLALSTPAPLMATTAGGEPVPPLAKGTSSRPAAALFSVHDLTTRSTPTAPPIWANDAWQQRGTEGDTTPRLDDGGSELGGPRSGGQRRMAPLMSEEEVELVRRLAELIGAANGMDWDGQVELQSGRRVGVRLLDVGLVLLSLRPSTVGDGGPGTLRVTRSSPQLLPPPPSPKTHASSTPILLSSPTPSPLTWFPDAYSKTIMGPLILAFPWHTTPLGPFTSWPLCLVQTLGTMLASPFREYLAWGEDFWFAYNDAYLAAAVTKHPVILGNKAETAFAEAWDIIRPPMRRAMQGETQLILNAPVPLERRGILEETYHTYSYTPVRDETGKIRGLLNRSFETTQEFVAQRRLSTVRNLVEKTHQARTVSGVLLRNRYQLHRTESFRYTVRHALHDFGGGSEATTPPRSTRPHGHRRAPNDRQPHSESIRRLASEPLPPRPRSLGRSQLVQPLLGSLRLDRPKHLALLQLALRRSPHDRRTSRHFRTRNRHTLLLPRWSGVGGQPARGRRSPHPDGGRGLVGRASGASDCWPESKDYLQRAVQVIHHDRRSAPRDRTSCSLECGGGADAKRAADLLALDRAKTSFFSNTSHELRTPLTLVLGPLEDLLARSDELPAEVKTRLDMVARNANRLLSMVNQLLDVSALEAGRRDLIFQPVNIGAFTADLASLFRDAIERSGLQFFVEVDEDPPNCLPAYLSRDLYSHVLFNLLGNALKYTRSGEIRVSVRSTAAEVVVDVVDTGVGIPKEELGRIFDRYSRLERTSNDTIGSGIGLALTLEMVTQQGGQLDVNSEIDKGSTFSVRFRRGYTHLPAQLISHEYREEHTEMMGTRNKMLQTELKDAAYYRETNFPDVNTPLRDLPSSANNGAHSGSSGDYFGETAEILDIRNATVLLVDDNHDLRNYIASLLRRHFTVVEFPDGRSALEYAVQHPPHLVLTDCMMPKLSGTGLLDGLRADPRTVLVPVIFLSAQASVEARSAALEAGVDDYIVKPFVSRELLARVRVCLVNGKIRTELEAKVKGRTAELNDSKQRYALMNEFSPVGIFMMDSTSTVVYANPRWYDITGFPPGRPLSLWKESVEPQDLPRLMAEIEGATSENKTGTIQFRFTRKTAGETWAQLEEFGPRCSSSVPSPTSRFRNRSRNPLSGVWQNAEVIQKSLRELAGTIEDVRVGRVPGAGAWDDVAAELAENLDGLEAIRICARHQLRIADDILNASKANLGLLSVNPVSFNVVLKMAETLKIHEANSEQQQIDLLLIVDPSIETLDATYIEADPSRLAQTTTNFILNSSKFTTSPGSITVRISASTDPPPQRAGGLRVGQVDFEDTSHYLSPVWVTCSVTDTGRGLSAEEMRILFERFAQVRPKTDQYGGSGLGLFVSKQLIELHHGFIEVNSNPGKGSRFAFSIPAERGTPSVPETYHLPSPSSSRPLGSNETLRSMFFSTEGSKSRLTSLPERRPPHILVGEDNVINQKVLKRQLVSKYYTVTLASNGLEALEILGTEQPGPRVDAVLMDIEMPVMGGLEAIKKLRAREAAQQSKTPYGVIAVTGNARQEQIDHYRNAGFDDVAIKPYDIQKLVVQIEQITGRPALPPESAGGRLGILERAEGPSNDSGYFTATHTPPTGTGL